MIISHKHKYLFVEIPLTASWSIHHELCKFYDGQPILHKHATYAEFHNQATREELNYFVFATVRNPLDSIVSTFFKIKNNQKDVFTSDNSLDGLVIDYSDLNKFRYIQEHELSFENYFEKFRKIPYSDMIDLSARHLDYVIRFENLQDGFFTVLSKLNLEQVRPLPSTNKTSGKTQEFISYYTPQIIDQAKRVCGPFMQRWDYDFPESWGSGGTSRVSDLQYRSLNVLRYLYTVYLRYNNAPYAVFLRKIRARLHS